MRKLSWAALISGLLAIFVLAGCGGGGGTDNNPSGGGNTGSASRVLYGHIVDSLGQPAAGYIVRFGGIAATSKTNGNFEIRLPEGQSVRDLYPLGASYVFSVDAVAPTFPPNTVIYEGNSRDADSIPGPRRLYNFVTTGRANLGTIQIN